MNIILRSVTLDVTKVVKTEEISGKSTIKCVQRKHDYRACCNLFYTKRKECPLPIILSLRKLFSREQLLIIVYILFDLIPYENDKSYFYTVFRIPIYTIFVTKVFCIHIFKIYLGH